MSSILRSSAKTATTFLLDALFPKHCIACHRFGEFLCNHCLRLLPHRAEHTCAHCTLRPTPNGDVCFDCREKTPLDGIFAAGRYSHPQLRDAIHHFKYTFLDELAIPLGQFLGASVVHSDLVIPDIVIPVPLHPRRERWRGWNQSLLLARELVAAFPSDIAPQIQTDILVRTRFTSPQMSIGKRIQRASNVLDAFDRPASPLRKFSIHSHTRSTESARLDLTGKTIWLIDDVAASGSTLRECAKVLKHHGAQEVRGIVLAR